MCLLFVTHACFSFSLFFYNNSLIVFLSLTIPVLFLLYIYIYCCIYSPFRFIDFYLLINISDILQTLPYLWFFLPPSFLPSFFSDLISRPILGTSVTLHEFIFFPSFQLYLLICLFSPSLIPYFSPHFCLFLLYFVFFPLFGLFLSNELFLCGHIFLCIY